MNRNQTPILLLGAGGHAMACIDVIEQEGRFSIAGLVGTPEEAGMQILGYPVIGTDADLPRLLGSYAHAMVTVGQIKSPDLRVRLFELLDAACPRLYRHVLMYRGMHRWAQVRSSCMVPSSMQGRSSDAIASSTARRWWSTMLRSQTIAISRLVRWSTAELILAWEPLSAAAALSGKGSGSGNAA
jgi:FlaA1/EpsC-like NDP-sugar epimerase